MQVGAQVTLDAPQAALVATGIVVAGLAHNHLALQEHGLEALEEVEGAELEAGDVGRRLGQGTVGLVPPAPVGRAGKVLDLPGQGQGKVGVWGMGPVSPPRYQGDS